MIEVERLTKTFGSLRAVDGVSFAVESGQIVGLLGPNGAGKTTTMRMLTTALIPSSGRGRVAGHDLLDEPLAVRRHLGSLPETPPLYPEMRVKEYLAFRAKLRDLSWSQRRIAIARVLERCALNEVASRPIGQLSKGFRQRVGLAEALLHDPPALILDEPTAGLDPLQTREFRALLRELGGSHAILLSTHILSEVEAVCDRALIISQGRLALDEPIAASGIVPGGVRIDLETPEAVELETIARQLAAVAGVEAVEPIHAYASLDHDGAPPLRPGRRRTGWRLRLRSKTDRDDDDSRTNPSDDPRAVLVRRVVERHWDLLRLEPIRSSLEERFVEVVARDVRPSAVA